MGCGVVVPLASGVCSLVGHLDSGASVGSWWEGLVSTLWWMNLCLVSLMGGAALESVFWGVCDLVWLYTGCLLISGAVFLSCWLFEKIPWGLFYQCHCPHGEPQTTPFFPEGPPTPLGRSLYLLWAICRQLKLWPGPTPTCTCPQSWFRYSTVAV